MVHLSLPLGRSVTFSLCTHLLIVVQVRVGYGEALQGFSRFSECFLATALPSHRTVFLYQGEKLNLFKQKHAVVFCAKGCSFPFLRVGGIYFYVAVVVNVECHS